MHKMSIESTLGKCQEEDLQFLIRKVEEKKRMLREAEDEFNRLCAKLGTINSELDELKLESFKVEGLIQKLDIRVKVYEQGEKELKEQDERANRSIEEVKHQVIQELDVRAASDRNFSESVTSMVTEYCYFKDSCLKSNVQANLQHLKSSEDAYTADIRSKLQNLGIGTPEWQVNGEDVEHFSTLLQQIYQPSTVDSNEVTEIRELNAQIQEEYKLIAAENAKAASQIDELLKRKSKLEKELNSLKKTWNK